MTSRSLSSVPSKTRSLGIATLFVLLGATVLPFPGCSDEPTPQPPAGSCVTGAVENAEPTDCMQRVCQDGSFVDQPDDSEIPDDGNECTTDSCSGGQAQHLPGTGSCTVGGTAGMCLDGTCKVTCAVDTDCDDGNACTKDTCDAASSTCMFADDPTSYDDNNDCTVDSCANGQEKHDNAPVDTACGVTGNGKCDGNGVCKGCTADTDCPAEEACAVHYCDLATTLCQTMPKPDGDLMDDVVGDCQLPACLGGQLVMNPNDADLPLDNNECTVDACTAGVPSNDPASTETTCSLGVCDGMSMCVQCVTAGDCMGDFSCSMNTCFDCNDGMMNGTESDIDCGRDCSAQCADGSMCGANEDCGSGVCDGNVCVSCGDGVINGMESDFDCGGPICPKCNTGQNCNVGTDCAQGVCNGGKCAAATCMDGVKNGAETDVDCGGSTCPKCGAGKMCTKNSDCGAGLNCVAGMCQ